MEKFELVATTLFGLEDLLISELEEIGAEDIRRAHRAVSFKGNLEVLYKSNLYLRTAIKVLKPIAEFEAYNDKKLYAKIKQIDWSAYLNNDKTFAIDGTVSGEIFTHSQYAALTCKDAIVDQFRENTGARPSIDTEDPDLRINIRITHRSCILSIDSSNKPLSKRGYKLAQTEAPINEVLAAAMILKSGWDKESDFLDPMCGSGTIPIEAALMANNVPAGILRSFGFQKWQDFDSDLWLTIKKDAESKIIDNPVHIIAYDIDPSAIKIAKNNAKKAGVMINYQCQDFLTSKSQINHGTIIINPPYGERMKEKDEIIPFYQDIGTHLKHAYEGCDAWIISSNMRALKFVGLRPSQKNPIFNGPLECRYNKYELYRGSKRGSKQEDL